MSKVDEAMRRYEIVKYNRNMFRLGLIHAIKEIDIDMFTELAFQRKLQQTQGRYGMR